jgi:hypothetical protein
LPIEVGKRTIPYGLTSPLAGTVDATVKTFFRGARNAELAATVAAAAVVGWELAAAVPADVLVLLEFPHPAIATETIATPKISFPACTGQVLRRLATRPGLRTPLTVMTRKSTGSFPCPRERRDAIG